MLLTSAVRIQLCDPVAVMIPFARANVVPPAVAETVPPQLLEIFGGEAMTNCPVGGPVLAGKASVKLTPVMSFVLPAGLARVIVMVEEVVPTVEVEYARTVFGEKDFVTVGGKRDTNSVPEAELPAPAFVLAREPVELVKLPVVVLLTLTVTLQLP